MDNQKDPKTGRFLPGNTAAKGVGGRPTISREIRHKYNQTKRKIDDELLNSILLLTRPVEELSNKERKGELEQLKGMEYIMADAILRKKLAPIQWMVEMIRPKPQPTKEEQDQDITIQLNYKI